MAGPGRCATRGLSRPGMTDVGFSFNRNGKVAERGERKARAGAERTRGEHKAQQQQHTSPPPRPAAAADGADRRASALLAVGSSVTAGLDLSRIFESGLVEDIRKGTRRIDLKGRGADSPSCALFSRLMRRLLIVSVTGSPRMLDRFE
ncbi:hypothetical protein AXG93_4284s1190 [Marchantia polymorpha subsp. ruderalis]|uniref:Uncharacterized protein n=1 Tax=Marchantia polymorpha subsp. ruderalis TaxID=1480154 RepID=A0A176VRQ7_MARPO|nr:hypothetical protein AXG93_4284s1190 [Marchantia polymorpha subsp. ruderalis]